MPTFFESMKRMLAGKPLFEPEDIQGAHQQPPVPATSQAQAQSRIRKGVASTFPVVYVAHTMCHVNGNHLEIYCRIRSTWPEQIMLDKIRLLGTTRELDTYLKPDEEREFLVYRGAQLTKQPSGQALLDYKTTHEGDYFEAVHDVTFSYRPDKTFTIAAIRLRQPIRDIYG